MIEVAIFSYNRVEYLKNCVDSVRLNMPDARLRIFDDNSDDPAMLEYLSRTDAEVVRADTKDEERHGGLYANMQRALDMAEHDYLILLQDDTQVVRPVGPDDLYEIDRIFRANDRRAFLCVLFMKAARMRRFRREVDAYPDENIYRTAAGISEKNFARRLAYFDVVLCNVGRLRTVNWTFAPSERANCEMARELFEDMPVMKSPFVFFCPEVPFFRNRSKTLAARIAARVVGTDLKRYLDLDEAKTTLLKERPLSQWPIAEDWLTPTNPKVRRPFVFKDVSARWWLSALHKIEMKFFRPK
ncbi:glycosyltransferase family A protein [Neogemmobacter tilapiae]|uniref:Glycosyltransferase 2-like domain-containing protein n=1 Tax=Neogemmobacter tilapiae TaxID=875041 RepID=A0A918TP52_9RHOB|nr:glycosyltransferase family A protein [Gemmobacter tilapiae]GHC55658.1 hypothetical protein GCM10007315_18390 [Gemmobacter tilapiae]